ncbi:cytochrome c oxidase assembly protein [Microvirga splendida]|uniref:Cytochrome c oxidase assembly protein n=1 Tax=Microvirga splendida TaxID=2795727 RepID=A0ABS0Y3W7_9HYPH|nr:cytochrome c oxidase assembly protein [Microvirga splendida]MBJ6127002.1 cytochrome c oxidase assembly protein [Microvirga splendida]
MRIHLGTAMLVLLPEQAFAHADGQAVSPDDLWHHWSTDPWVLVPLVVVSALYMRGVRNVWSRAGMGRGVSPAGVMLFAAGILCLLIALVSPLDALSGTLLTAHMVQHAILIAVAPPLLIASRPEAALTWSLSHSYRRGLGRSPFLRSLSRRMAFLAGPIPGAVLHGLALWLWHAPALFEVALRSELVHTAEHMAFFGTALLFWRGIAAALRSSSAAPAGIAAGFLTLLHGCFLSALITFSPRPLYVWYGESTMLWGLDPLADQQLAGLIMGAPLTLVYLLACLALAARLLTPARYSPATAGDPAS